MTQGLPRRRLVAREADAGGCGEVGSGVSRVGGLGQIRGHTFRTTFGTRENKPPRSQVGRVALAERRGLAIVPSREGREHS